MYLGNYTDFTVMKCFLCVCLCNNYCWFTFHFSETLFFSAHFAFRYSKLILFPCFYKLSSFSNQLFSCGLYILRKNLVKLFLSSPSATLFHNLKGNIAVYVCINTMNTHYSTFYSVPFLVPRFISNEFMKHCRIYCIREQIRFFLIVLLFITFIFPIIPLFRNWTSQISSVRHQAMFKHSNLFVFISFLLVESIYISLFRFCMLIQIKSRQWLNIPKYFTISLLCISFPSATETR